MMRITVTTENYGPSKELTEKFDELCMIAAAKILGINEIYQKARDAHDSLAQQFNAEIKKEERGFFGQIWDNYTNRSRSIHKQPSLEDNPNFS